jgi:predicted transcriptional regulator
MLLWSSPIEIISKAYCFILKFWKMLLWSSVIEIMSKAQCFILKFWKMLLWCSLIEIMSKAWCFVFLNDAASKFSKWDTLVSQTPFEIWKCQPVLKKWYVNGYKKPIDQSSRRSFFKLVMINGCPMQYSTASW